MNEAEITKLLTIIAAIYPRFEVNDFKIALWLDMIGDLPYKVAQMAVKKVMLTSEFPPTIAEIRKAAVEIITPKTDILDAGKAWGEVQRAISKYGWCDPKAALESMSPVTQQVVKQLSWKEICNCENISVVRGQFMKMFDTLKLRNEQDKLLPADFKKDIALIAGNIGAKQIACNGTEN